MTDRLSLSEIARLQRTATGFSPRPAAPQPSADPPIHFSPDRPAAACAGSPFPDPDGDPLRAAWAQGFEAGRAEGDAPDWTDVAARIEHEVERMGRIAVDVTARRLRDTVVALAGQLLAEAALDQAALTRRIGVALSRLGEPAPLTCRCHPDAAPAARAVLPPGVAVEVDASLAANAFRLSTATGGLADGPEEWAAALAVALDGC